MDCLERKEDRKLSGAVRRWGGSGMAWGINIISLHCKKFSSLKIKIYFKKQKKAKQKNHNGKKRRRENEREKGREFISVKKTLPSKCELYLLLLSSEQLFPVR